jgi:hypothetical protein
VVVERAALSQILTSVITTIVLIRAEPASIPAAAQFLAEIDGVTDVYSVSGDWDLVAIVKVAGVRRDRARRHRVVPEGAGAPAHADLTAFRALLEEGSPAGVGHRGRIAPA